MSGKSFWALRRKRTGTFEPTLYKSEAAAKAKADQMGMFDVVPLFSAAPVREEAPACKTCGGKGYTEHEGGEGEGYPSRPEIEACACREEAPERRHCDECGFIGTSGDASKEQDYCTACGGNSPAGGPDECANCGAKNHMVMACPKCGGRFSLDEDAREEAPAPTCQRCGGEIAGWCCQNCPAEFRENDDGVLIFDDREAPAPEGGAVRSWMFRESPSERWHVTLDRRDVDEYLKAFSTAEVHPLAIAAREDARPVKIDPAVMETALGGSYDMPDGRKFWIDVPVAREMTKRALAALQAEQGAK